MTSIRIYIDVNAVHYDLEASYGLKKICYNRFLYLLTKISLVEITILNATGDLAAYGGYLQAVVVIMILILNRPTEVDHLQIIKEHIYIALVTAINVNGAIFGYFIILY